MTENDLNPQDVQKALVVLTGTSPSELRASLRDFDTLVVSRDAVAQAQTITVPPPPSLTAEEQYIDTLPLNRTTLDPGLPVQPPGGGGPSQGVQVVVTGVLNGVAASGTAFFTGDPTPL